jgi:sporulation protein YlmC with PRC-barrel domain
METLDETATVISAGKVTGTAVYNTAGDHLGEIHDVMLDKRAGRIAVAEEARQSPALEQAIKIEAAIKLCKLFSARL